MERAKPTPKAPEPKAPKTKLYCPGCYMQFRTPAREGEAVFCPNCKTPLEPADTGWARKAQRNKFANWARFLGSENLAFYKELKNLGATIVEDPDYPPLAVFPNGTGSLIVGTHEGVSVFSSSMSPQDVAADIAAGGNSWPEKILLNTSDAGVDEGKYGEYLSGMIPQIKALLGEKAAPAQQDPLERLYDLSEKRRGALDPNEALNPGEKAEFDRLLKEHPEFVASTLKRWVIANCRF